MPDYLDGTGVATLTADTIPTTLAVTPASITIIPDGTRTVTAVFTTVGGRTVSAVPTSWTVADSTNFTVTDNLDGTATYGANTGSDTLTTTGQAHYASGPGSPLTSNTIAIACSSFAGMSSAAHAIIEGVRTGLADELVPTYHEIPGVTPLSDDFFNTSGYYRAQPQIRLIDPDPDATYGQSHEEYLVAGVEFTITALTRGNPTLVTCSDDVTGYNTGRGAKIKWYNGDPTSVNSINSVQMPPDGMPVTITGTHTLSLAFDSSGWFPFDAGSDPSPVIRYTGGVGGAKWDILPDFASQTFPASAVYKYWNLQWGANYVPNDGAGSQKGEFLVSKTTIGGEAGGYFPGWIGFTPTLNVIVCDRWQGNPISPPNNQTVLMPDTTPGVYTVFELVWIGPETSSDDTQAWILIDGVQQGYATFRSLDFSDPVNRAWRFSGIDRNNVYGGGGSIPPVELTRRTAEGFISCGYARLTDAPDHFTLTVDDSPPYHGGQTVTMRGVLKDGNGNPIDTTANWLYGTNVGWAAVSDLDITLNNGSTTDGTRNALSGTGFPAFTFPATLAIGTTTISVTLHRRSGNNIQDGTTTSGSTTVLAI